MEIRIEKTQQPKAKHEETSLGFGQFFTDHMFVMDYTPEKGWYDARIIPFQNFSIHPASTVLHYGSEIFEGLKAYRAADGSIRLFRPYENAKRLNSSAERLCLPQLPEEYFIEALETLIRLDQDWVPSSEGTSLYIRPFLFGNDETLGVHTVHHATFAVIISPYH